MVIDGYIEYKKHMYWTRRKLEQNEYFIYYIKNINSGHIKIGWSRNPQKRIRQLQPGAEGKLIIMATQPGGPSAEASIHRHFKRLQFYGEWYKSDSSLLGYISDILEGRYRYFDESGENIKTEIAVYYEQLKISPILPEARTRATCS